MHPLMKTKQVGARRSCAFARYRVALSNDSEFANASLAPLLGKERARKKSLWEPSMSAAQERVRLAGR